MWRLSLAVRFLFLALGLSLFLCAQNPTAEQRATPAKFRIAGTIVNAVDGAPLGKARVSIFETADRANTVSMITSENGHFAFPQLTTSTNNSRPPSLPTPVSTPKASSCVSRRWRYWPAKSSMSQAIPSAMRRSCSMGKITVVE